MSVLDKVIDTVVTPVVDKAQATIPVELQIRVGQALMGTRHKLLPSTRPHTFVEAPIPDVDQVSLDEIDMSNPFMYRQGQWLPYFKRLRAEAPVHYQANSPFGPFWSVTRYDDILAVDKNHHLFSAEPYIVVGQMPQMLDVRMFIAMDPPKHDAQRSSVQPVVAPKNLKEMEALIRSRTQEVLDSLPVGEPFNWVELVSKDLTARMLATLIDWPQEERRLLTDAADVAVGYSQATGGDSTELEVWEAAREMVGRVMRIWKEREAQLAAGAEPGYDLISLLLASEDTKDMPRKTPMEFLGNLVLLAVGGNDTTRNSMSGGVLALNQNPDQFEKLKANPELIPTMVSEMIRWQTPLAYMARIAKEDTEVGGVKIKKGEKLLLWYASGNRDESHFDHPDDLIIDRKNARSHIAFGFGIHRCMGNRLAELQLKILWEEILERFDDITVVGEPELVQSNFVRGYEKLMVTVTPASD